MKLLQPLGSSGTVVTPKQQRTMRLFISKSYFLGNYSLDPIITVASLAAGNVTLHLATRHL